MAARRVCVLLLRRRSVTDLRRSRVLHVVLCFVEQALTAVWTALADINFLGHFPLVDSNKAAGSRGSSPSVRGASELSRSPPPSLAVRSPASGSFLSASTSVSFPTFSSLFEKTRRSSPRGPGLQVSAAGVWWMLDRLCEETRLLRLDHTVNTNMVTKLAEAMLKLNVRDDRTAAGCGFRPVLGRSAAPRCLVVFLEYSRKMFYL